MMGWFIFRVGLYKYEMNLRSIFKTELFIEIKYSHNILRERSLWVVKKQRSNNINSMIKEKGPSYQAYLTKLSMKTCCYNVNEIQLFFLYLAKFIYLFF